MKLWILPEPNKYLPKYKKCGIKFGGWIDVNSNIILEMGAKKGQILVNTRTEKPTKYYRIKGTWKRKKRHIRR